MKKVWILLSALLYVLLAYFVKREQIELLLLAWGVLFVGYFWVTFLNSSLYGFLSNSQKNPQNSSSQKGLPFGIIIWLGIAFRLIFLFAIPALSDDFYRFVWDGRLLICGENPFLFIPTEVLKLPELANNINSTELFRHLNSPNYYSVYPPLNQYLFGMAAWVANGNLFANIVALRCMILTAESGTLWLLYNLKKEISSNLNVAVYALNPLVIVELTGNLHFEAVVIFFLVLTYYMLQTKKSVWQAALAFASAVAVKLLPLIFIPFIIKKLRPRKGIIFSGFVFLFCAILFSSLLNLQIIQNILKSLKLYFQTFEFNGSIYYLVREIGFWIHGYNIIETAGRMLSVVSFLLILFLSFWQPKKSSTSSDGQKQKIYTEQQTKNQKQKTENLQQPLLILTIYLLFATTVHPWYITPLVLMGCFGNIRFPLVWSALIPLTYFSYTTVPYKENPWLVVLEYVVVVGFLLWEVLKKKLFLSAGFRR